MQSRHIHNAEIIFNKLNRKTVGVYGAMMKGKDDFIQLNFKTYKTI